MKIQIISDLHLEFENRSIAKTESNVIVLAGDIHNTYKRNLNFAGKLVKEHNKPVISVFGNHEFYTSGNVDLDYNKGIELISGTKDLYLLECSSCIIDNIKFIGCTLWTDFSFNTGGNVALQEDNAYLAQAKMTDFRYIRHTNHYSRFNAMKCIKLFNKSKLYLKNELSKEHSGKTVIITHFTPHINCMPPKINKLSAIIKRKPEYYYVSEVSDIIRDFKFDLWISGHSHYSSKFELFNGEKRFVSNQIGYPGEVGTGGKLDFVYEL